MYSPVDFTSSNDFKTTLLYAFRSKEKESSYLESIVQRRGWLDSIVFGLQLLLLFFSSYRVHSDDITGQHQWIVRRQNMMAGLNLIGMVIFSPIFRKNCIRLFKYLAVLRVPLLAISHLFFTFNLRDNTQIPQVVLCSQIWPEASALEKLMGFLVWHCLFPLFAAFPFKVALSTVIANVCMAFATTYDMCYMALDICPKTSAQYISISKSFRFADILFPTGIADAADPQDLPRCAKSLGWIQMGILGPVILYILMMVEIKNRRTYAGFKSWDCEQQEYKKRQQPLWKSCGELFLALMLTRQILSTWNNHVYRETLLEQF